MSFQPGPTLGLAILALLYIRAVRVLGRRGFRVPVGQQAFWWAGWLFLSAAFLSPLDEGALKVIWAHMAQHVIMADIAVPLLLVGARNPVLQFLLPRPILEPLARRRALRSLFRRLRRPAAAVGLYALGLYLWHLGVLFEGALRNEFVHALQHQSFIALSALVWWPIVEPNHRRMPGHLWKIPYILGARIPTMFLGMAFIVAQSPFYSGFYGTGTRPGGLSWTADQQLGGAMMMMVDMVTLMVVLTAVFWRAASDEDAKAPAVEAEAEVQPLVQIAQMRQ
jgi:putative copper resistance protein D